MGFIPSHLTFLSKKTINLVSANGQPIRRGDRTANVGIGFTQVVNGKRLSNTLDFDVSFYEADIEVDAILSYPWMSANKIGIFPHHCALARDEPEFTLLYGKMNWRANKEVEDQISLEGGDTRVVYKMKPKHRYRRLKYTKHHPNQRGLMATKPHAPPPMVPELPTASEGITETHAWHWAATSKFPSGCGWWGRWLPCNFECPPKVGTPNQNN